MSSSVTASARKESQASFPFDSATEQHINAQHTSQLSAHGEAPPVNNNGNAPQHSSLKLKGSLVPMTALELTHFEPAQFEAELQAKIAQAPDFFENLPVIVDIAKLQQPSIDFTQLQTCCATYSIKIVAVRGGSVDMQQAAKAAGLSVLAAQKERNEQAEQTEPAENTPEPVETKADIEQPSAAENADHKPTSEPATSAEPVIVRERQVSKVVHHPIRSGQQVYASDGDLIVMASVSAGAEILADGNIHVYGTLRGRALAGVKGDTSARIFCQNLSAELVSVAGQYKISEDISADIAGKPAQVFLDGDTLHLKEIEQ